MANTTKKKVTKKVTTNKNVANKVTNKKTVSTKKKTSKKKDKIENFKGFGERKRNIFITIVLIFILAVLLIVSSYAWFSTALNVKIRTFNMIIVKNEGLTISHDAVTYGSYIDISRELLYDDLDNTYPNNLTMWPSNGLIPVSTNGNSSRNSHIFDVYTTNGVLYPNRKDLTKGIVRTSLFPQDKPRKYSYFLAFDVFFKNDSGSPIADNLYFDFGTGVKMAEDITEEMQGLVNSVRFGIVKVGSLPITATPTEVQNIKCNNDCEPVIFEPLERNHTNMSIENASKYGITLVDGEEFPTYANVNAVEPTLLANTISGSPTLDTENFKLQETINENDFVDPIFTVPYGYTKARIYVWIEGQDIDSLETNSDGTDIDLTINFVKDTQGYKEFYEE